MKTHPRKKTVVVKEGTLNIEGHDPVAISSHGLLVGRFDEQFDLPPSGAHLFLRDPKVSHCHCRFTPTDDGIELEDVSSLNGTLVDGVCVKKAVLNVECVVMLGETRVVFRPAGTHVDNVPERIGNLVGKSPVMRRTFALLQRAAASPFDVVLRGETGTGKELAARAIHDLGLSRKGPYQPVD